jgi:peptidoglycan/LPS O-acetylase OafA/YrhL
MPSVSTRPPPTPAPVLDVGDYRPELDGLRCLAVGAVMAFHTLAPVAAGGYIGVDVFFVLSGFLITSVLLRDLARDRSSLRRFYLRRVARLGPALAAVCLTVGVVYAIARPEGGAATRETLLGAATGPTYAAAWIVAFTHHTLGRMGPTWSLSVEEHFYLVWPVLLGWLWSPDSRVVLRRVSALLGLALLYRLAGIVRGVPPARMYYSPDFRAEQLLLGCLLATALAAGLGAARRRWDAALVVAAAAVLVALALPTALVVHAPAARFYAMGGSTAIALASAVVIRHLFVRNDGHTARALARAPLVWIGQRSYGLYLWHYPVYGLLAPLAWRRAELIPTEVALSLVAAAVSYRWVEMPVRNRVRRRTRAVLPVRVAGPVGAPPPLGAQAGDG